MSAPPALAAPSPEAITESDELVFDELYRDFT